MKKSLLAFQSNIFNEQINNLPEFKVYLDFFKGFGNPWISFNDRSKKFTFPIHTYIPDQFLIPEYSKSSFTYDECCFRRAKEIVTIQEKTDLPIRLLYSGGIDSSVVLASFIEILGIKEASKRIKVEMNQDSINENPLMWYKIILPNFDIINSTCGYSNCDYGNWLYVTGELNDQLFGAEIQQDFENWNGQYSLNKKIDLTLLTNFFIQTKNIDYKSALVLSQMLIDNLKSCPTHQNNIWDLFWWYNFTWKWMYVYFRFFLFFKNENKINQLWLKNNYFPFFDTVDYQQWSMNSKEEKHHKSFDSYKFVAKNFVSKFLKSKDFMTKSKKKSLPKIIFLRSKTNAITKNFEIYENIDIHEVLNKKNSIIQYEQNI